MPNEACWSCGAKGPCFIKCGCRKCVDPIGYQQFQRNQPGNNSDKARADRENRLRLERNGQQDMTKEIWNREKMFSTIKEKLKTILERMLEAVESGKDEVTALRTAANFLREFSASTADLIEFAKDERWQ